MVEHISLVRLIQSVYDLDSLPLHEIVLVTINYRLGPFGFLKLDEISNGEIQSTGNEGLMDQKLAIEWVQENIAEFGGDPEQYNSFWRICWSLECCIAIFNQSKWKFILKSYMSKRRDECIL